MKKETFRHTSILNLHNFQEERELHKDVAMQTTCAKHDSDITT